MEVTALCVVQCFDTVGLVIGKTFSPEKSCAIYLQKFSFGTSRK